MLDAGKDFKHVKATANRDDCISCGLCASTCPKVFHVAEDGFAEVYVNPALEPEEKAARKARGKRSRLCYHVRIG
jgi:ferredoxin